MVCRFSFSFSTDDMLPLQAMQGVARSENILQFFAQHNIMSENIMRRTQEMLQAMVMAQAVASSAGRTAEQQKEETGKEKDKELSRTYAITYYNPELKKTEVIEAKSDIKISDPAKRSVEEAVGSQSPFPIYSFIGAPLMKTEVIPWKLEEILGEREYDVPKPPPTGAAVTPVKVIGKAELEAQVVKAREEEVKAAVEEAILRKERAELKVDEEILLLEEVVAAIRGGDEIDKILARLPPLSRARYILLMRKKRIGRAALINMLLREALFLKTIKKKLELFTLEDLKNMYNLLRGLQLKKK
ncbi:MAG: hypothetical protein AB1324_05795 [Candidatus Micrarchaeota archaeon]